MNVRGGVLSLQTLVFGLENEVPHSESMDLRIEQIRQSIQGFPHITDVFSQFNQVYGRIQSVFTPDLAIALKQLKNSIQDLYKKTFNLTDFPQTQANQEEALEDIFADAARKLRCEAEYGATIDLLRRVILILRSGGYGEFARENEYTPLWIQNIPLIAFFESCCDDKQYFAFLSPTAQLRLKSLKLEIKNHGLDQRSGMLGYYLFQKVEGILTETECSLICKSQAFFCQHFSHLVPSLRMDFNTMLALASKEPTSIEYFGCLAELNISCSLGYHTPHILEILKYREASTALISHLLACALAKKEEATVEKILDYWPTQDLLINEDVFFLAGLNNNATLLELYAKHSEIFYYPISLIIHLIKCEAIEFKTGILNYYSQALSESLPYFLQLAFLFKKYEIAQELLELPGIDQVSELAFQNFFTLDLLSQLDHPSLTILINSKVKGRLSQKVWLELYSIAIMQGRQEIILLLGAFVGSEEPLHQAVYLMMNNQLDQNFFDQNMERKSLVVLASFALNMNKVSLIDSMLEFLPEIERKSILNDSLCNTGFNAFFKTLELFEYRGYLINWGEQLKNALVGDNFLLVEAIMKSKENLLSSQDLFLAAFEAVKKRNPALAASLIERMHEDALEVDLGLAIDLFRRAQVLNDNHLLHLLVVKQIYINLKEYESIKLIDKFISF